MSALSGCNRSFLRDLPTRAEDLCYSSVGTLAALVERILAAAGASASRDRDLAPRAGQASGPAPAQRPQRALEHEGQTTQGSRLIDLVYLEHEGQTRAHGPEELRTERVSRPRPVGAGRDADAGKQDEGAIYDL